MIKRDITEELKASAGEYPVVSVFGPRQSGKTTLAQMTFPDKFGIIRWKILICAWLWKQTREVFWQIFLMVVFWTRFSAFRNYSPIFNESSIGQKKSMFILTGSLQPELHQSVSQTLAGRTAVLSLLPFSLTELRNYQKKWEAF